MSSRTKKTREQAFHRAQKRRRERDERREASAEALASTGVASESPRNGRKVPRYLRKEHKPLLEGLAD